MYGKKIIDIASANDLERQNEIKEHSWEIKARKIRINTTNKQTAQKTKKTKQRRKNKKKHTSLLLTILPF
jgi:hypothetical protein